jgi:hypothetical protein
MDATSLVSAWNAIVVQLCYVFTEPTARVWRQIALGWVLHRGPATVTGIYRTLGDLVDRHWTVYEKFFYRAAWSLNDLSLRLVMQVVYPMIIESGAIDQTTGKPVADLAIDDTTAARCGRHVAHAGWFKDASASGSSHRGTVIHWAHNWIVGAVTLRLPTWPLMRWALPVLFCLYRKRSDCDRQHPFRTRQVLAAEMVQRVVQAIPQLQWRISADGQYATRQMVQGLPPGINLVSRIRSDAALYDLPPTRRRCGQRGAPRKKGKRLPAPREMARRRKRGWRTITVQHQGRTVQRHVLGVRCLWYHVCRDAPIGLVIVRDPSGIQRDDFLFCTEATVPEEEVVQRYLDRWGVEEAIFEGKQHLGFESTRGWCSKTVNRQAPLGMVLVTLVKAWYARCAKAEPSLKPQATPWYGRKSRPSFADMLSALRVVLWHHRIISKSGSLHRVRRMIKAAAYGLFAAA